MQSIKIDAHQHFWKYNPVRDAWITEQMPAIRRDFMPGDLEPLLHAHGIDGCIAVQAGQSEEETSFLLELAARHSFIRGVVGWADLRANDLERRLDHFSTFPALRGFRHILQAEPPEFMLEPSFLRGVSLLGKRGFTYDILVFPRHLKAVLSFIKKNDHQSFIIDHLAKPYIKRGLIKQWENDMRRIARHEHVYCKISGLTTEAPWGDWQPEQLWPYMEVAFEAFGARRVCYGSDWPVCLLAADYRRQMDAAAGFVQQLSAAEQAAFWGENAAAFYHL